MNSESKVDAGFQRKEVFVQLRNRNRMHHREALGILQKALEERKDAALRVLDIGCGDARETAPLFAGFPVTLYVGIDNDPQALEAAGKALAPFPGETQLLEMDYQEGLDRLNQSFDLVWMGLFLHHLSSQQKMAFFKQITSLLAPNGLIITHDPVTREGEKREDFLRRIIKLHQEELAILSEEERQALQQHWAERGHQESFGQIKAAAEQAGFNKVKILWRDPEEAFAVLSFTR